MCAYDLNRRRVLQAGVAGTLAMATARRPARAAAMPFTVVPESEVVIVDPHMTTAAITRTFGYHIFDTLFSMGAVFHGTSGHPGSPHYADQNPVWSRCEMIPMLYDWDVIVAEAESSQRLCP